jgi:maleate isomerase
MAPARPNDGMVLIEHLPFETDDGIASRARLGLLVLATDFTIEHEWRAIMAGVSGVALYESRILNEAQITPETLRAMEPRIAAATDVILPGNPLDVVAYGCTSASMAIGEERLFPAVRAASDAVVCAPGTSCRHQIHDGTGREALHPVDLAARALGL